MAPIDAAAARPPPSTGCGHFALMPVGLHGSWRVEDRIAYRRPLKELAPGADAWTTTPARLVNQVLQRPRSRGLHSWNNDGVVPIFATSDKCSSRFQHAGKQSSTCWLRRPAEASSTSRHVD